MKRKFFSWLLAICMILPGVFAFNACGGGGSLHTMTETEWQDCFDEVNFEMRSRRVDAYLYVAENSYGVRGVEYGKDLSYDGETLEYYKAESGEVVSLEAAEYVDYAAQFATFFDFVQNNYSNFVMHQGENDESMQFFVYDGELPENVQACVDQMITLACENGAGESPTYNYHSIAVVANYQYLKSLHFMDGEYDASFIESYYDGEHCWAYMSGIGEQKDYQVVKQIEEEKEMEAHYEKLVEALQSVSDYDGENTNFVVKGGTGVDYMEFYFTDKGLRFYTPNANTPQISGDSNIYVDGIYTKYGDTYKYYKQSKAGAWSVQEITADRYDTTLKTFYEAYCGGKWFDDIYAFMDVDFSKSSYNLDQEYTDSSSMAPYTLRYYNISVSFDENDKIKGATWKLEMQLPEIYGGAKVTYDFTLTAGNASFTIPTIA
ncbi:MAG: hypothetical protein IJY21_02850 [Clostridia bacterium]|nr:hypothetical protein [Clostridia bacterium]